jgi:mono/diheme cytochrome c family protein
MKIILQLIVLTVGLTGFYMMVGQAVPQKEVHPPEVVEIAADVSTADLVEIGKGIFNGKGLCTTCHTLGKSGALRFPDLDGVAVRAATRKPGYTAIDYLAESLYEPDAFIVPGFSPGMAKISKPPIGLNDQEILAVIAYLQTLGGTATVTMDTKTVYTGGALGGGDGGGAPAAEAGAETAVAAAGSSPLETYGCTSCHYSDRPGKLKASSLYDVGSRLDRDQIFLALGEHESEQNLDQVTIHELQTLVQTLTDLRG